MTLTSPSWAQPYLISGQDSPPVLLVGLWAAVLQTLWTFPWISKVVFGPGSVQWPWASREPVTTAGPCSYVGWWGPCPASVAQGPCLPSLALQLCSWTHLVQWSKGGVMNPLSEQISAWFLNLVLKVWDLWCSFLPHLPHQKVTWGPLEALRGQ